CTEASEETETGAGEAAYTTALRVPPGPRGLRSSRLIESRKGDPMSGLVIAGQLAAGTVSIKTLNRRWDPDGAGKLMLTKTSQVIFSGVAADVQHPLKIGFLVKSNQDVDSFRITSDPSLVPVPDDPTASDAERVFGSDSGDKWVGWKIPYVGHWSTTLETEI